MKVRSLVAETVDMLNSRGFKYNKARVLADAMRTMRNDIGDM